MDNTQSNTLAVQQEKRLDHIRNYMLSPQVKNRFAEMMGRNALYYLNQVLIVVANSPDLQQCTPGSILSAAMRAASLRLSVDTSAGQVWILAYKNNRKNVYEASFQLGYRGVYELAQRTGKYRFINMIEVFEGEEVTSNRMTGIHAIGGKRTGSQVIGYMLYFQLVTGFEKTYYMTVKEIEQHAERYSPSYRNPKSPWNNRAERPKMMEKTVLANGLRKWGVFNESDKLILDQIEDDQPYIGLDDRLPAEDEVTAPVVERHTEAENMAALGFGDVQAPARPEPPAEPEPAKPYTREDAARDLAQQAAQPELIPTESAGASREDLSKEYYKLFDAAGALGIAAAKFSAAWTDEKIAGMCKALRDAIAAREAAIPG